jgi:alkylation response protein AidB-like acyl-CoA dehydrogenase
MLEEAFRKLLVAHCPPAAVRAAEAAPGAVPPVWAVLEESGFFDVLRPEAEGGAGLSLAGFAPLVMACGEVLLPLEYAGEAVRRATGTAPDLIASGALTAAKMAGACVRLMEMTVAHVGTRRQFGRPLAAFQAVQQQLAVMAEEVVGARMAAHIGLAGPGYCEGRSAVAKLRCGEAAQQVTGIAHQLHGAIGATADFDLQFWVRALKRWQLADGSESYWAERLGVARLTQATGTSADFVRMELQTGEME